MQHAACRVCGCEFPRTAEFWHRERTSADGLRKECRLCKNAARAKKYEVERQDPNYREKKRAAAADWYAVNREKAAIRGKSYNARPEIKQKRNERDATRRVEDPAFVATTKARVRQWYEANAEHVKRYKAQPHVLEAKRAADRAYRLRPENFERIAARVRQWLKDNPDVQRAATAKRRAKLKQAPGSYTAADLGAILSQQEYRCYWCGDDISGNKHHADHFIPIARGGTNWPENIVGACGPCNCAKGAKMPDEFWAYLERRAAMKTGAA